MRLRYKKRFQQHCCKKKMLKLVFWDKKFLLRLLLLMTDDDRRLNKIQEPNVDRCAQVAATAAMDII